MEESKICCLGKGLTFPRQILDTSKLKQLADNYSNLTKMAENSRNGSRTLWQRKNYSVQAISPLPKVFSKDLYSRNVKTKDRVNPLPDDKILDWSKFTQIADDNLKCI